MFNMASKRAIRFLSIRTSSTLLGSQCSAPQRIVPRTTPIQNRILRTQGIAGQRRWHSAIPENQKSKVYEFDDVLDIVENPSSTTQLIDVREPHEFSANAIPTSLNIPIVSHPDALLLPEDEFEDRFGFQKPPTTHEVVFYCKAGVRSSAAAQLAKQGGYEKVGEYRGSWLDWERRGGPGTKTPPPPGGKGEPTDAEVKE